MACRGTHKVRIPKNQKFGPPDTKFAAEMHEAEARRREAFIGDFHERWAERLRKPIDRIRL